MSDTKKENSTKGLTPAVVHRRLGQYGFNEFETKKEYSIAQLLIQQFKSPLIYILLFAGVLTLLIGDKLDAVIILFVVFSNTLLGFWQEFKAAKSLEALKSYLKPIVKVVRDGSIVEIPMRELVPGDIVLISSGNSIPADGLILRADALHLNEAILTGESRSVAKQAWSGSMPGDTTTITMPALHESAAQNFVFMGTLVSTGVGEMLVVKTGNQTEMGKIAKSLATTQEDLTPLQVRLAQLARTLMFIIVAVTIIIFVIGISHGKPWLEMFEVSVAVAVAAIPEGLAVSMTVILALGMQRIFLHKALVRKLVAAETLGSVSVICCDKTGTLTEGKVRLVDYEGDRSLMVRTVLLANDERDEEGLAMSRWGQGQLVKGVSWTKTTSIRKVRNIYRRISSIPFDSKYKFMAVLSRGGSRRGLISMVGAPEVVLSHCSVSTRQRREILYKIRQKAMQGFRLIGVAEKKVTPKTSLDQNTLVGMDWLGFVVFQDPIRPSVKHSLAEARRAGLIVKVITGDHKETARAVFNSLLAKDALLQDEEVISGEELKILSKSELKKRLYKVVLFARTTPDQKLAIVNALRSESEVVAMTGDGVNDAPALKAADIGIVVNEASDVSKQTADMVLLDNNFKTIIEAIREGRIIYETMRKVVAFLLTDVFQELMLIGAAVLMGLPLPITAVQVLWINLIKDSFISVAMAFDASDEGVMDEKPRKRHSPILDNELKSLIFLVSIISTLVIFGVYLYLLETNIDLIRLQTFIFVGVATNSLFYVFSISSLHHNIWDQDLLKNKYLILSVFLAFVLTVVSLYVPLLNQLLGTVPLTVYELSSLVCLGLVPLLTVESVKYMYTTYFHKLSLKQL